MTVEEVVLQSLCDTEGASNELVINLLLEGVVAHDLLVVHVHLDQAKILLIRILILVLLILRCGGLHVTIRMLRIINDH